ncbi:alpha/beta fold hydrolase [Pseudorhodoferax sp.]|uniref:alpha/beta fold hydrolase n=1 Tax=Pseudorhodoferax sp. TaxID=1993553 RepID=UPI0039E6BBA9
MSAPPDTPVVLLLPGLLCDEAVWRAQRAALAGTECVVPRYGLAGSIGEMARIALSATDAPRLAVAGHSMGGRVALEMARIAPERIQRVALLDTGMDPLAAGEAGAREVAGRQALLQTARSRGMRAMGLEWARGMVHPDHLDTPVFADILAMIERRTPDEFAAQIDALVLRPNARGVLAALRCPTLLACGRQDLWSPLARHEEMQRLCPAARLCVIEHSGHMTTMEQPAAVSALLREWLSG